MKIEQLKYDQEAEILFIEDNNGEEIELPLHKGREISVVAEVMAVVPEDLRIEWAELKLHILDFEKNLETTGSVKAKGMIDLAEQAIYWRYCDGFGTQELSGTIMLSDGTWLERGEYDGSEWWEHRKPPTKPDWV